MAQSGRARNLLVTATANPSSPTIFTVQTYPGGAGALTPSALHCTVPATGPAACSDTDPTHAVAVNAGDAVGIKLDSSSPNGGVAAWGFEIVDAP